MPEYKFKVAFLDRERGPHFLIVIANDCGSAEIEARKKAANLGLSVDRVYENHIL